MALEKYVSEVKTIANAQDVVYNHLSNFENLSKYVNEGLLQKINESVPQITVSNFESDADSCRFTIAGMGDAEICIVDREAPKNIKLVSSGNLPLGITFWIQLLPAEAYKTKLRLTLHAEMSMMIKMMVNKKLKKGVDDLADMLTKLPY